MNYTVCLEINLLVIVCKFLDIYFGNIKIFHSELNIFISNLGSNDRV